MANYEEYVANVTREYKKVAEIPIPQGARIHQLQFSDEKRKVNDNASRNVAFSVSYSQKDLVSETNKTYIRTCMVEGEDFSWNIPNEDTSHCTSHSPCGKYTVAFKVNSKDTAKDDSQQSYFIEVWDRTRLISTIPTKGKHGFVYNDEWFGGISWSRDSKYIAYVAEPAIPGNFKENSSFQWSYKPQDQEKKNFVAYDYVQDWGEGYPGKKKPSLFVVQVIRDDNTDPFHAMNKIKTAGIYNNGDNVEYSVPKNISVGQVTWSSQEDHRLLYVGWDEEPFKLGIKYCYNRRCGIYQLDVDAASPTSELLTTEAIARCPKFLPNSNAFVYIGSTKEIKTHNACFEMYLYDFQTRKSRTLVNVVNTLKSPNDFPGLFCDNFPKRCFLDNKLYVNSQWLSQKCIVQVDTTTGAVTRVLPTLDDQLSSCTLLDTIDGLFVASISSPNSPPSILFGTKAADSNEILWKNAFESPALDVKINCSVETLGNFPSIFQYILMTPVTEGKLPLVVFAHGGPHSAFNTEYAHYSAFVCTMGYALLQINYRGSTGFGQDLIDCLPGACGSLDVQDCLACVEHAIDTGRFDTNKLFYTGGSHGGFLGGHLINNNVNKRKFRAVVLRNPVIEISSMLGTTDIPDWCMVEGSATRPEVEKLFKCSPLNNVDYIDTPTLLVLGDSDRRVPNSQGMQLYTALKEKGVPTCVKMYPASGHAITKVELEADNWVHSLLWFYKFSRD